MRRTEPRARAPRALLLASVAALAGCPESPGYASLDGFAGAPFAQADLAGDWRYAAVFHGPSVASGATRGWERGTLRIGASGAVSAVSAQASDGGASSSAPSPWTLDRDGFGTAPAGSYVGFNLKLNAKRTMAAATGTTAGSSAALWILLRADPGGSSFGADLAGTSWSYHRLTTGAAPAWEHGIATVDAARVLGYAARMAQAGPQPDRPSVGTVTADATGLVTLGGDATWQGILSADGNLLVATSTGGASQFALEIWVRSGQRYAVGDLEGRSSSHALVAGTSGLAGWSTGVFAVDASGRLTWLSSMTNAGQTSLPDPASVQLVLAPDGTVTIAEFPTAHSTVLCSKDGSVRTQTSVGAVSYASLGVNLR
jgi:hypothetical protein